MQPMQKLEERVHGAIESAQARLRILEARSAHGGTNCAIDSLHEAVVEATRKICCHIKAQLQLDALQELGAALAALPPRAAESAPEAFARVKAHLSAQGGTVAAERDRLEAEQADQMRQMSAAALSADLHRVVEAMSASGAAIVRSVKALERLRAAAVALMHLADDAFVAGDGAAVAAFVAEAYPAEAAGSVCSRLLEGVVAALQDGFGEVAGLARVSAALQRRGADRNSADSAAAGAAMEAAPSVGDIHRAGSSPRRVHQSAYRVRAP